MELYDNIEAIERRLFCYEIKEAGNLLTGMIKHLVGLIEGWPADRMAELQTVLRLVTVAMENADYQLVADVLHFELKPLLRRTLA